jgi:MFS family permease
VLSGTFALSSVLTFVVFGAGAVGCVVAGLGSERWGRTRSASAAMIASGSIALFIGFLPDDAEILIVVLAVIGGLAVVADSAQFSTAMSELADPNYVGSALAIQTAMGFALTILSIRLLPIIEGEAGWGVAFAILAMLRLRQLPEAAAMANGRR